MKLYDLSILIPSYRRLDLTRKCVERALRVPALEVIVSDDNSDGNVIEALSGISDRRLRIFRQEINIGLWENHLFLLQQSIGEWVYFLQTDDSFNAEFFLSLEGGTQLGDVSIIHSDPMYLDLVNQRQYESRQSVKPGMYQSSRFLNILRTRGNLLGRPSYNIYRRSLLPQNVGYWRSDVSADLVMNTILSCMGRILILKPYLTICGIHPDQDGKKQSLRLAYTRALNASLLLFHHSKATRKFARAFFRVEFLFFFLYWLKDKLYRDVDHGARVSDFFRLRQSHLLLFGRDLIASFKYLFFKLTT